MKKKYGKVHKDLQESLKNFLSFSSGGMNLDNIPEAREQMINSFKNIPISENIDILNKEVPSIFQDNLIKIRIYTPKNSENKKLPVLLWTHGGGYLVGNLDTGDLWSSYLCEYGNIVVVSVDYRLAPEHQYPAPIYDAYSVLKWVHTNEEFNWDMENILIGGDSAGGGLAASLALYNRDQGDVPIKYQLLIYPMLDSNNVSNFQDDFDYYIWNKENNLKAWTMYLGYDPRTKKAPIYASPLNEKNLENLPETFMGIGSIDLFLQEGISYASNLLKCGISTELHIYPGAFHAFPDFDSKAQISLDLKRDIINSIKNIIS